MEKDFIIAARAKGVNERDVITKHALKNAILPVITKLGMTFCGLLGGAVIIESIYSWPGLGIYMLRAIDCRDILAIQGYIILMACFIVIVNLVVDILYVLIDPKIKVQ